MRRAVVAIDGPAGAGKSTVARQVAERLGYVLLDTGALYRTVALAAERAGVSWDDEPALSEFAAKLAANEAVRLERAADGTMTTLLSNEDVSGLLRTQSIAQGASKVSAVPGVRTALLALQRAAGANGGVVVEGRDIGTVVFPGAEVKVFLTASVEVRAQRRFNELAQRGERPELSTVREEVVERDERDSTRAIAPLRRAPDAVELDSSALGIEDVVQRVVTRVQDLEQQRGGKA
jgi:cytidylate kinase